MPPSEELANEVFDVVVLGAGPAGTAAARAAAEAGASVCLLERMDVPRYKTCGGGLVGLSTDHARIDLAPLVRARVDALTLTFDGRRAVTRHRRDGQPLLSMVMRSELDAALLDAAKAAGALIRTAAHVTGLSEDDGPGKASGEVTVLLRSGPPVRARVVVGADGTSGRAGTYVGVTCDQVDVGL
ncbi:FAD-dependent monooxygenase, partial [Frankia sp. EI5c]|uniref:FAD-dependent monooxygenase n=1 Tax=Frankia sp. EI5c TaxID=683316 RepID=UPI001F5BAEF2